MLYKIKLRLGERKEEVVDTFYVGDGIVTIKKEKSKAI